MNNDEPSDERTLKLQALPEVRLWQTRDELAETLELSPRSITDLAKHLPPGGRIRVGKQTYYDVGSMVSLRTKQRFLAEGICPECKRRLPEGRRTPELSVGVPPG